jgi:glutamate racemase
VTRNADGPIGVFDSGVGGFSVLKAIRSLLPDEDLLFVADQVHVPYGSRPLDEVRRYAKSVTEFLLACQAKLVVVACNTASAAALYELRQTFPQVPFVGLEPAVKPAAAASRSRVVGVLATPATFQGRLYASVVERFAREVTVLEDTCPGLVLQIEHGCLDGPKTRSILESAIRPMLAQGADTLVLGCTHYPFVIPLIETIAGPDVCVIDPAPAVARQASRMITDKDLANPASRSSSGALTIYTSGDPDALQALLPRLLGFDARVLPVNWHAETLVKA